LPAEITLAGAVKIDCRARVLRIQPGAESLIGIAAQITDFDLLPSPPSVPFLTLRYNA